MRQINWKQICTTVLVFIVFLLGARSLVLESRLNQLYEFQTKTQDLANYNSIAIEINKTYDKYMKERLIDLMERKDSNVACAIYSESISNTLSYLVTEYGTDPEKYPKEILELAIFLKNEHELYSNAFDPSLVPEENKELLEHFKNFNLN
jgi:hypothetical protein